MVRNGQVADSFYSLIQPEPNYYYYWCQRVHGLSQCDTDDAPVFSKVWQQLEEKITDAEACAAIALYMGHLHNHVGLTENFDQSENEEFLVNDSP